LLRQHDAQAGTIRVGGHDIRNLDPHQVRGIIAIVAQDTTLFDGTIAGNLRLGRPDASGGGGDRRRARGQRPRLHWRLAAGV
jgi:ATP-binding cassette, subfamily B, bacterial